MEGFDKVQKTIQFFIIINLGLLAWVMNLYFFNSDHMIFSEFSNSVKKLITFIAISFFSFSISYWFLMKPVLSDLIVWQGKKPNKKEAEKAEKIEQAFKDKSRGARLTGVLCTVGFLAFNYTVLILIAILIEIVFNKND